MFFVVNLRSWPIIKTDDAKALDSFSIYLKEFQFAIENVEAARVLEILKIWLTVS